MKTRFTLALVIAWFAIMVISTALCSEDQNNQPCIEDTANVIASIPGMEGTPYTDTAGNTWIIYK